MKATKLVLFFALIAAAISSNGQNVKKAEPAKTPTIEAYYFHFTARCATCLAVEAQAEGDINTLYPELVKNGTITFKSINLDDATSKALANKLKVTGQTLLFVAGGQKVDLTNEGFLYAESNPDKLKEIIKQKMDGLLK
ncbi:MAG TPA: nitrophenyl compound nitroreductase subunit ArsF family protein [Williamwhitmania sp.]|nr:nitrophenyl compound nitroreductase subunit ArsF family protein [Williamwhitmania sp.]